MNAAVLCRINEGCQRAKLKFKLRGFIVHGYNDFGLQNICKFTRLKVIYCVNRTDRNQHDVNMADFCNCFFVGNHAEIAAMKYAHIIHVVNKHGVFAAKRTAAAIM